MAGRITRVTEAALGFALMMGCSSTPSQPEPASSGDAGPLDDAGPLIEHEAGTLDGGEAGEDADVPARDAGPCNVPNSPIACGPATTAEVPCPSGYIPMNCCIGPAAPSCTVIYADGSGSVVGECCPQ